MPKLIIIGAGGLGKEVAWTVRKMQAAGSEIEIAGYCDDRVAAGTVVLGYPVLGTIEQVATGGAAYRYICAVGLNKVRPALVDRAESFGWKPYSVIHPSVHLGDEIEIGDGSYVAAGAYIGPGAKLARHTLVNVLVSVGHDVVLEEHTQICPGVKLSGNSVVRRGAFLGSNAVLAPGKTIGEWSTVSAATFIANDIPAGVLVMSGPPKQLAKPGRES